jgi:beta-glucosidase
VIRRCAMTVGALFLALTLASTAHAEGRCGEHPWCDTSLSPERRDALLLGALTPDERIQLLAGDHAEGITGAAGTHVGAADGIPRLEVPPLYLTDGPVGVRQGRATAFPTSMALAASFDRASARKAGAVVAVEARLKGNDVVYGPTVNILRTPLWGRAFESLGEDPFLTASQGVAWIRGAQAQGVIANVKHFAVNNQEGRVSGGTTAGGRFTVDARIDERTLREIYLPQFEAAVKQGGAGSVMCSYNRLNGPHACESRTLLDRILRRDWGFRGFVLADYGASKRIDTGLAAGLDFEPWPFVDFDGGENYTPAAVQAALAAGRGNQAQVDRAVRRLLRTLFAFGFFDRAAYVDDGPASTEPAICASRASSRRPGSRCSRTTARCRSTRAGCARWR